MATQLTFASIRQAELAAADAWELLIPVMDTESGTVANQVFDVLRAWTWKALDRRRRDADLREWAELLNRVEAFYAERFAHLASKLEVLADLLHESLAVSELASPNELMRRKHVLPILSSVASRRGAWVERAQLMGELALKPANMTRLMSLLVDMGWIEQETINGREAAYRISAEGASRLPAVSTFAQVRRFTADRAFRHLHVLPRSEMSIEHRADAALSISVARTYHSPIRDPGRREWERYLKESVNAIEPESDYMTDLELVIEDEDYQDIPALVTKMPALAGGNPW